MATPTPDQIARAFVAVLHAWLSPTEWTIMTMRNRDETDPGICHSHDVCDANMAMAEAFRNLGIEVDVSDDAQVRLWTAAWEAAMPALRGQTADDEDLHSATREDLDQPFDYDYDYED